MSTTTISRKTPWEDALLEDDDLFAMLFPEGWLVGRVLLPELVDYHYDLWPAIPAGQVSGPIVNTEPMNRPLDIRGAITSSILFHDFTKQIWQFFMGVDTPVTWIFEEYPLGSKHGKLQPSIGPPTVNVGAFSGWGYKFGGWESFYGEETAASMAMLPYKTEVGYGIANLASYQIPNPKVRWLINKCIIEPFDPSLREDAQLIMAILRRQTGALLWTPGVDGWQWQNDFRGVFGVNPVILSKTKAYYKDKNNKPVSLGV